eukprot:6544-Pyramimonas_sp.AAC.1
MAMANHKRHGLHARELPDQPSSPQRRVPSSLNLGDLRVATARLNGTPVASSRAAPHENHACAQEISCLATSSLHANHACTSSLPSGSQASSGSS